MERTYMPRRLHSNVTDVLDLSQYFFDYWNTLNSITPKNRRKTVCHMMEYLGVCEAEVDRLKEKFLPMKEQWKHFQVEKMIIPPTGFHPDFKLYEIPENPSLRSLLEIKRRDPKEHKKTRHCIRYAGQVDVEEIPECEGDKGKERMKEYSDYLLTVRIYHPAPHAGFTVFRRTKQLQVSQELLVYGQLTLDKLRDRIFCPEDITPAAGDVSENPFQPSTYRNESLYPSSMFFINNIFYIDGRIKGFVDYSEVVKKWAADKKLDIKYTEFMEHNKFNSIVFRLGYPYLYMHQGNCEHLIIFTDARLVSPKDLLVKSAYPVIKAYAMLRGKLCMTCTKRVAKFIVVNMERLPVSKSFLCGVCLHQYCYIGTQKIGDFTVYKYVDKVALL